MRCLGFLPISIAVAIAIFSKNSRDLSLNSGVFLKSVDKSREFLNGLNVYYQTPFSPKNLSYTLSHVNFPLKNLELYDQASAISLPLNLEKDLSVKKDQNNLRTSKKLRYVYGGIQSSFYQSLLKKGIDPATVNKIIKNLAHVVNFQHGIRLHDPFEVLYEVHTNSDGKIVRSGDVKYIGLFTKGKIHQLYSFNQEFFNAKGESTKRSLLSTPLNPRHMRISSHFQKNRYLNGYCRDHKGIDYGAPHGAEVFAAGSGVVVKAGWGGAYGNMVKIRHQGNYETLYAHLSRIPQHIRPGVYVTQQSYIGNVGSTGRSTGPHLHYETIYCGVPQNPLNIKHAPSAKLSGLCYSRFQAAKRAIDTQIVGIPRLIASKSNHTF